MKGSKFVFDYIHLLHYKCHETNSNRCGSYIDSPDWIESKKETINCLNKEENNCFQQAVTVVLSHKEIKKDPQRITNFKTFINKYNWEGINFPSEKNDWEIFRKSNATIALNVLFAKKEKKYILLNLENITQIVKNKLLF